jgi:hypothetical protein
MGQIKRWQIVLFALALVGVGVMTFYSCSTMDPLPSQAKDVTLVDIRTGELFIARYPDKRPVMFPANNPDDQQPTLYPALQKEGAWVLNTRYMAQVRKEKALKADLITDQQSGALKVANNSPKRADIFK